MRCLAHSFKCCHWHCSCVQKSYILEHRQSGHNGSTQPLSSSSLLETHISSLSLEGWQS